MKNAKKLINHFFFVVAGILLFASGVILGSIHKEKYCPEVIPPTVLSKKIKDSISMLYKTKYNIIKKNAIENAKPFSKSLDSLFSQINNTNTNTETSTTVYNNNTDTVDKLVKEKDSLLCLLLLKKKPVFIHDTIFTYKADPMIKEYYNSARLSKIGIGQNSLPLYGLRLQLLYNHNFTTTFNSVAIGARYDFNKFSFLFAEYYNINQQKFNFVFNTRFDLKRF